MKKIQRKKKKLATRARAQVASVKSGLRKVGKVMFKLVREIPRTITPKAMYHDDNEYRERVLSYETRNDGTNRVKFWRSQGRLA